MNETENGYKIETKPVHEIASATRGGFGESRAEHPVLAYPGRKFSPAPDYLERYGQIPDATSLHDVLCRIYKRMGSAEAAVMDTADIKLLMDWAWTLHLDAIRLEQSLERMQDALEDASC